MKTYSYNLGHLLVALFTLVTLFGFTAPAAAQTPEDTIESLSAALQSIGAQVASSPNISDADRLMLLTQLIEVSQAIVVLQELALQQRISAQTDNQEGDTNVSALVNDDVYRFVAQVDLEEREAEVTTYYHHNQPQTYRRETQTIRFTAPDADDTFAEQVRNIEDQLSRTIANDTGYNFSEVRGYLFMSAYNPDREEEFIQNSPRALVIASDFAERSLVESVTLVPDEEIAQIVVSSDQSERVTFEIERNGNYEWSSDNVDDDDRELLFLYYDYDVTASMYLTALNDYRIPRGDDDPLRPLITYTEEEMSERDVLEFISGTFSGLPFAEEIPDLETNFLRFMFETEANYEYRGVGQPNQEEINECIDPADRLILDEYVVSLLQGMQVQFINQPGIVVYALPTDSNRDISVDESGCRDTAAFF